MSDLDSIEVASGHLYQFHATAGTLLCLLDGSADVIDVPVWLGGGLDRGITRLAAGDSYRVEQTGYVGIKAVCPSALTIDVPVVDPGPAALALRWLLNRLPTWRASARRVVSW